MAEAFEIEIVMTAKVDGVERDVMRAVQIETCSGPGLEVKIKMDNDAAPLVLKAMGMTARAILEKATGEKYECDCEDCRAKRKSSDDNLH